MKTKNGFVKFDTISEFKTWLFNQSVSRRITRLQVHHMDLPNYSTWENTDKKVFGSEPELGRTLSLDSYGKGVWHSSDGHGHYIAQHFNIFPNGKITSGRNLNSTPIGIRGWNTNAICIEIYGDFDKDKMTTEQKNTVIAVYALLCQRFKITPSTDNIRYHCWFTAGGTYIGTYSSSRSCKTCPGTKFFGGNSSTSMKSNFLPLVKKYMQGGKVNTSDVDNSSKTESQWIDKKDYNCKAKTIDNLNLRKGRGTKYSIITTIPKGTEVAVGYCLNGWLGVYYGKYSGFCSAKYLKKI